MDDLYVDEVREGWRIIMKSFINFTLPNTGKVIQWRTQEFCLEGVQQIQLRTERIGIWGW